MTRVKRGLMTKKRHKNLLAKTKWFKLMNKNVFSRAKNALAKSWANAYIWRKLKKRNFRTLWNIRINNALKEYNIKYSRFINALYNKQIKLNRKVLSNLAISNPDVFKKIVEFVK
jgi:large subunit ribosomal protein L20